MSLQSQTNPGKIAYGASGGALSASSGIHGQLDIALDIVQRCAHKSDMVLERIEGPRPQDAAGLIQGGGPMGIPEKLNQIIKHLTYIDDKLGEVLSRF